MIDKPLLDDNAPWKQRYRVPLVLLTQLAKSAPERGMAASNRSGKNQLYAWDVPSGELRQVTFDPTGKLFGSISPDGRWIYYKRDQSGNEIGHYVRVPFEGGEAEDLTPQLPPYSSWILSSSRRGNRLGLMAAQQDGFHLYQLAVGPDGALDEPRLLYHSTKMAVGPIFSHDGDLAVVATLEHATVQNFNLVAFDANTGERLVELWDGDGTSVEALSFAPRPGDARLLATSNRSGVRRPLIWDARSGQRTDLSLPELEGEVFPVDWFEDGQRVLLCQVVQAKQQMYVYDLAGRSLVRLEHPGGEYGIYGEAGTYCTPAGEIFAQWQDSSHPSQLVALDARTGKQVRTVLPAGQVPASRPLRPVSFPSANGEMVQAWLGLPEGNGPFPTILDTHGGPEAVQTEAFWPAAQCWLDHGFAVISVNYHGSTTFGKAFQESIWGAPGQLEVEDMAAARAWLVEQGVSRPDQVFLTGWSYGGYLTLQALGTRPDLWAGGMAGVAIADWRILYEDSAPTLRGYDAALFGGTPQDKPEQYAASSPITYAENVRAPVLILQGRHDTRTPARPVEMYEARLRELGKPVEVHWFEAGHLGAGIEQDIQHQEMMLSFAYKVLRGGGH